MLMRMGSMSVLDVGYFFFLKNPFFNVLYYFFFLLVFYFEIKEKIIHFFSVSWETAGKEHMLQ